MKVKIQFTLDIDAESWALEYGVEPDEIPEDVRSLAVRMVEDHLASLGLLTEGE